MYTYKLGGMMITDELYHDDLDSMTFGRKDQNELYHYGIKGQSWGKRRFQNEDGSLTSAGRNRYDVGMPTNGATTNSNSGAFNKTSAVNKSTFASSNGSKSFGGASGGGAKLEPPGSWTVKTYGSFMVPGSKGYELSSGPGVGAGRSVTNKIKSNVSNSVNSGLKAANKLFSNIGSGITGTATKAANAASNLYTGNNHAQEAERLDNIVQNYERAGDANINAGNQNIEAGNQKMLENIYNLDVNGGYNNNKEFHKGLDQRERGEKQIARGEELHNKAAEYGAKADAEQSKYDNAPRQKINNALGAVSNWVGDRAQDVAGAATNAYNGARDLAGQAGQAISDWYTGDKAGQEAQRYDNVVQNFERNGERNIDEGVNKISDSIDKDMDRIDIDLHGNKGDSSAYYAKNRDDLHDMSNEQFWKGLDQRNLGYDQHDVARQYGQKADEAQARYDAAPRQRLAAAGDWIRDRASDVGSVAGNAANAAADWVGDRANDIAGVAKNVYNDINYGLYSLGQDIAEPAKNRAWQDFQDRTAKDREIYDREFPTGDLQKARYAESRINDAFRDYGKESNRISNNPIGSAINNVGRSISEGAQNAYNGARELASQAGQAASNAASSVRDWGAGAVDKGRQAFENLFGRSEPQVPTLSDPNPQIETETILRENIIPEQRITEQRIPEQIIPETREIETRTIEDGFKPIETRTIEDSFKPIEVNGSETRPLTKEENELELKRVNDRLNNIDEYYDHLHANNDPRWSNFTKQDIIDLLTEDRDRYQNKINQQQEAERTRALSDKPSGLSDDYWMEYKANGGTRAQYERELKNRRNNQNGSR